MVVVKQEDKLELYFLDSRNRAILTKTNEELSKKKRRVMINKIVKIIKDHYDAREKQTGVPVDHRPWREKMFLLSYKVRF
jgi:hypothetical protein